MAVTDKCHQVDVDQHQEIQKGTGHVLKWGWVLQAVGRVVGALCVLSAKDGDAESAMLASWVSQASFVPPGITIAVSLSGLFPHNTTIWYCKLKNALYFSVESGQKIYIWSTFKYFHFDRLLRNGQWKA